MSAVRDVKVQYAAPSALKAGEGRAEVTLGVDGSRDRKSVV